MTLKLAKSALLGTFDQGKPVYNQAVSWFSAKNRQFWRFLANFFLMKACFFCTNSNRARKKIHSFRAKREKRRDTGIPLSRTLVHESAGIAWSPGF